MIRALVYKDLKLLFNDNTYILLGQCLFVFLIISINIGILGYSILVISLCWAYLMNVSAKEKETKGTILLISTPYRRKQIIMAKYVTCVLLFVFATGFYIGITKVCSIAKVDIFQQISTNNFFITLFSFFLFVALTLPMYLKFDDSITKMVSLVIILGTVFIGYGIYNQFDLQIIFKLLHWINKYMPVISMIGSTVVISISYKVSLNLINNTEY